MADIAKLKRRGVDYDMESAADLLGERAVYGDVIKTFRDKAADKRTVVYCTTVEHSMKTAAEFVRAGFVAEHIDGATPPEKRDAIIKRFKKGKTQILTNCQIVDVGFDLPAIEVLHHAPTDDVNGDVRPAIRSGAQAAGWQNGADSGFCREPHPSRPAGR